MGKNKLRSGYTTGACAAAAAKAALQLLIEKRGLRLLEKHDNREVDIPFPDGSRATFRVHNSGYCVCDNTAFASVIKDAGDDPDVTNGVEIVAEARLEFFRPPDLIIKGGKGVGVVTKPGLAVPIGGPAINPVPRKMIHDAVSEASAAAIVRHSGLSVEIAISVPDGDKIAKKTLNERLGIIGGISILGTAGIVRPLSSEAWTAAIVSSLDVAKAMGRDVIVLSAGRTSEKAHIRRFGFPEESYVLMGDYLEFSLREAAARGFAGIHLCAQWAKMLKIAMATPQTHVRHGAIAAGKAVEFLDRLGVKIPMGNSFNTAREIFDYLLRNSAAPREALTRVCNAAKSYAADIAGPVSLSAFLSAYDGEIIETSDARSI